MEKRDSRSDRSSRRRVFAAMTSLSSLASLVDDEDVDNNQNAICALGQILSGALFGFLFGIIGFVLAGEATRSFWWILFVTGGSAIGTYVARATGATVEETHDIRVRSVAAVSAGAVAGAILFYAFLPASAFDTTVAPLWVSLWSYAAIPLSTPQGRARASLGAGRWLKAAASVWGGAGSNEQAAAQVAAAVAASAELGLTAGGVPKALPVTQSTCAPGSQFAGMGTTAVAPSAPSAASAVPAAAFLTSVASSAATSSRISSAGASSATPRSQGLQQHARQQLPGDLV